jgi:hypothetical protein
VTTVTLSLDRQLYFFEQSRVQSFNVAFGFRAEVKFRDRPEFRMGERAEHYRDERVQQTYTQSDTAELIWLIRA